LKEFKIESGEPNKIEKGVDSLLQSYQSIDDMLKDFKTINRQLIREDKLIQKELFPSPLSRKQRK